MKVGLLSLRDCSRSAGEVCALCRRPVCKKHLKQAEKGPTCHECLGMDPNHADRGYTRGVRRRRQYYRSYGYAPFYYGSDRYYSDCDYRSFDHREHRAHDAAEAMDHDDGDWDDDMDLLES